MNCSFFLKTGSCRFGDRCSRHHPRPSSSTTLLIPGMYSNLGFAEQMLDERDHDVALEVSTVLPKASHALYQHGAQQSHLLVGENYSAYLICDWINKMRHQLVFALAVVLLGTSSHCNSSHLCLV